MKIVNIIWDIDGKDIELPTEIEVQDGLEISD